MSVFLLINGANLNLLRSREQGVYGVARLADIDARCISRAADYVVEIHLSDTFAREELRPNSYFSDMARSCLFGFGAYGHELALQAASHFVASTGD
jgi:3-dehydroquinate dehydratase